MFEKAFGPVLGLARRFGLPQFATAPFCPSEVAGSVVTPAGAGFWTRLRLTLGPGLLVAVGYMDPGNWTTNLQGGAKLGGGLAAVVVLSGLVAIGFQLLAARQGIAAKTDLAMAIRRRWGLRAALPLWLAMEIAIVATDVAEVLGAAVALDILFGLSLPVGVLLTSLDVFLVLGLKGAGFRRIEAIILGLIALIAAALAVNLVLIGGPIAPVLEQASHPLDALRAPNGLFLALGIVGATLMPHNLFLHSSVVGTRRDESGDVLRAARWSALDTIVTLSLAIFVNLGLLVFAALAFHAHGLTDIADLQGATRAIAEGGAGTATKVAATIFALGLLASGLSSTFTGTIVGQVVMEGFLELKIPCWLRRVITRGLALVPALLGVVWFGRDGVGDLLEASQVTLAALLPFALAPLILLSGDRGFMGVLVAPRWTLVLAWVLFGGLVAANAALFFAEGAVTAG